MQKVIIVGAGVTGLALARGLQKADIPFIIYEKNESQHTRRNWTFGIHWGIDALKELLADDVIDRLEGCQVDPHHPGLASWYELPLLNAQTGDLIKILDASKFYRLRRDKVRDWLAADLDVRFGKDLTDVVYSSDRSTVKVTFADGTQDSGSLLVGCDGAHSKVRELLVGKEASRLDSVENIATVMCYCKHTPEHAKSLRAPPNHPLYQVGAHPDGLAAWFSLQSAEDPDKPEDWTFFQYISYRAPADHATMSTQELLEHQKQLSQKFSEPWKWSYQWMDERPEEVQAWFTRIQHWDPSSAEHQWNTQGGLVTLAGDSSHPMSFQRGQGLNNALEDARQLCRAVKMFWSKGDAALRASAISTYEAEMKDRGGREVRLSAKSTILMHDPGMFAGSALVKQGMEQSKS